jgi:glucokinase
LIQLPVGGVFAAPLPNKNRAVLGPGTGLGVAHLQAVNEGYHIVATEAGHAGFGCPPQYARLANYLEQFHGSSYLGMEAFVSGPAIANITGFLSQECRAGRGFSVYLPPLVVDPFIGVLEKTSPADLPSLVSANTGNSPICFAAMNLFFEFLAIACSSVALQSLSLGGLFLAGGILPKNIESLYRGPFLQNFTRNWKKQAILAQIPLYLVLDYTISLIGCAAAARERLF